MGQITNPDEVACLLGHHDYDDVPARGKDGNPVQLCKVCKRSGYRKCADGTRVRFDYDEKGNCICKKWDNGDVIWFLYDEEGNAVVVSQSQGEQYWLDNDGNWVDKKPTNWKYDPEVTKFFRNQKAKENNQTKEEEK